MLRLVNKEELKAVAAFCENDAVGVRIASLLLTYGFNVDFTLFWVQVLGGEYTAAVSRFEGNAVVFTTAKTDFGELKEFLNTIGYASVLMKAEDFNSIGLVYSEKGDILEFSEKRLPTPETQILKAVEPERAYRLLQSNVGKSIEKAEYLPWLSDYTYRKNRGYSRIFGVECGDALVSSAMTVAESEETALLGGVVTNENYRCRGYARGIIYSLIDELRSNSKKRVFIYTREEKNTRLYEKIGFVKISEWGKRIRL